MDEDRLKLPKCGGRSDVFGSRQEAAALGQEWIGRLEVEITGVLVSLCLMFSWLWSFPVSRTSWLCLHSHGTYEDLFHAHSLSMPRPCVGKLRQGPLPVGAGKGSGH